MLALNVEVSWGEGRVTSKIFAKFHRSLELYHLRWEKKSREVEWAVGSCSEFRGEVCASV